MQLGGSSWGHSRPHGPAVPLDGRTVPHVGSFQLQDLGRGREGGAVARDIRDKESAKRRDGIEHDFRPVAPSDNDGDKGRSHGTSPREVI